MGCWYDVVKCGKVKRVIGSILGFRREEATVAKLADFDLRGGRRYARSMMAADAGPGLRSLLPFFPTHIEINLNSKRFANLTLRHFEHNSNLVLSKHIRKPRRVLVCFQGLTKITNGFKSFCSRALLVEHT